MTREDSEVVQRAEDMRDAFACTASEKRFRVNDELVREKDVSCVPRTRWLESQRPWE